MPTKTNKSNTPVFYDNDGAMDDIVNLILLLTNNNIRLTGISITNANCKIDYAVEVTLRLLELFGRKDIEIAKSDAEAIHTFPERWREYCAELAKAKAFEHCKPNQKFVSKYEAAKFTADKILSQEENTTYVLTGPASNLAKTIELYPEVKDKIDKVVWMGGAFLENGNVKYPDHDGSAEWNFFWDPFSVKKVLNARFKVFMFPLDACVFVPVDSYVMYHLGKMNSTLSKLVHSIYQPFAYGNMNLYFWDAVTAAYLALPDFGRFASTAVDVEIKGTSMGNIYRTSKGNPIRYATSVDEEMFYEYILEQLKLI